MQSSTSGIFKKLQEELDNYRAITSKTAISAIDVKDADRSLSKIFDLFERINGVMEEIGKEPIHFINPEELKKINAAKKALDGAKEAISKTAIQAKK